MSTNLDKIDFAALKTIETHPNFDMGCNFGGFILEGYNPQFFTSKDGARKMITEVPTNELIYEIGLFCMEIGSLYEEILMNHPEQSGFIKRAYEMYPYYKQVVDKKIDAFPYLLTHKDILAIFADAFGYYRYHRYNEFLELKQKYNINVNPIFEESYKRLKHIKNVRIRTSNVNKCLDDLREGEHLKLDQSEYSLDGKMFTFSDKGRVRHAQEDSSLIMSHPDNREYRLIGVADGMGGLDNGGDVSTMALNMLANWFEDLDVEFLDDPDELNPMGCAIISRINKKIFEDYQGTAGCTLCFAIVANGKTMVFNVGDSRCYVLKDNELTQVTKDDSVVYSAYEKGFLPNKDDLRFHPDRNIITKGIGVKPNIYVNNVVNLLTYDLLLFFTDGVTDMVSDEDIKLYASGLEPKVIAKELVRYAKYKNDKREIQIADNIRREYEIHGGEDNLTAAVFNKRG